MQISRFIRLTELIPEILNLVDDRKLGMRTGVELSYISKDNQKTIFEFIDMEEACPTHAKAIRLRKLEEQGDLTEEIIHTIMREQKPNQEERISIKVSGIKDYLPPGLSTRQYEEYVVGILKKYKESLRTE